MLHSYDSTFSSICGQITPLYTFKLHAVHTQILPIDFCGEHIHDKHMTNISLDNNISCLASGKDHIHDVTSRSSVQELLSYFQTSQHGRLGLQHWSNE